MPTMPKNKRRSYLPAKEPKKPTSDQSFYNSARWRKTSIQHREAKPLCQVCLLGDEHICTADVVDHIVPIEQGGSKFDSKNHMGMCHRHHNRKRGLESRTPILVTWKENAEGEKVPVLYNQIIHVLCGQK